MIESGFDFCTGNADFLGGISDILEDTNYVSFKPHSIFAFGSRACARLNPGDSWPILMRTYPMSMLHPGQGINIKVFSHIILFRSDDVYYHSFLH